MFALDKSAFEALFNFGKNNIPGWILIFFGKYLILVLIVVFIAFLFFEKETKKRIQIFGFFLLSEIFARGVITEIIRFFYHRPRPFSILQIEPLISHSNSGSIPSGHSVFLFSLAFSFLLFKNRKWSLLFFFLAVLGSIGRVFVGVHWFSDIVISLLISFAVFLILKHFIYPKKIKIFKNKNKHL